MPRSTLARLCLSLPGRLALLCGLGALSAAGAPAEAAALPDGKSPVRVPQQSAKTFGEMAVWSENGRIFVSEDGGAPQELALGDTEEARRLRELLARGGADARSPQRLEHRIILVGGGGDGFHWAPSRPAGTSGGTAPSPDAGQTEKPQQANQPTAPRPAPTPDPSQTAKN